MWTGVNMQGGSQKHVPSMKPPASSAVVTRRSFKAMKSGRSDEVFTNHESIPSREKASRHFVRIYPEYQDTIIIDEIRSQEYTHLDQSGKVCLDYTGYGLFSSSQQLSFGLSYVSANLPTHALYGEADAGSVEFEIKLRVLEFLNIQESEYAVVFTASRGAAFKLLAESYPFHLKQRLLTVYDYQSEGVLWMEEVAERKGAEVLSANFRWPSQHLWATDLKMKILDGRKKTETGKGLFVFPVQSRVTGAKYSFQWMSQAQENGWDILLDASALGPKIMGSLGLSVFHPDFIVTSFFKVYGLDPTGFACLLIKRSSIQGLHASSAARGVGMVRLLPAVPHDEVHDEDDAKDQQLQCSEPVSSAEPYNVNHSISVQGESSNHANKPSTSGLCDGLKFESKKQYNTALLSRVVEQICQLKEHHMQICQSNLGLEGPDSRHSLSQEDSEATSLKDDEIFSQQEGPIQSPAGYEMDSQEDSSFLFTEEASSSIYHEDDDGELINEGTGSIAQKREPEVVCRGLDHADKLGLSKTNTRLRCLINWLVGSMLKLHHPGYPNSHQLVQIYGPKLNYDRGPSVAFNLFDWRGDLIQPILVQRLADRSNISLSIATLHHICLSKGLSTTNKNDCKCTPTVDGHLEVGGKFPVVDVVMVTLGFISSFGDVYRLWAFLAKFLDADFVSKEVWRYRTLNQEIVQLDVQPTMAPPLH